MQLKLGHNRVLFMPRSFNYNHLYYFWVVAKEGGISHAAQRLGMAVQTVSAQVRTLEQSLGFALFKPAGRGLALTAAGEAALRQADAIFQLGVALPAAVRDAAAQAHGIRLAVGISDGLAKMAVQQLLKPVLHQPGLRLLCHEGEIQDLLADLALHRLDVVLADRPAPPQPGLRLQSHALAKSPLVWVAPPIWAEAARQNFPQSLATVPVLLPTAHSQVRAALDAWFDSLGFVPNIVGEFEDSALLATFGAAGMGAFPVAEWVRDGLTHSDNVQFVGSSGSSVLEHFYAVYVPKKVMHPLVQALVDGPV